MVDSDSEGLDEQLSISLTEAECRALLEKIRWNGNPTCPYCGSARHRKLKNEERYQCNSCFTSYSITVGTIFHKSHASVRKWFLAILMITQSKTRISVRRLASALGINKNTALRMRTIIENTRDSDSKLIKDIINSLS